MNMKTFLLLASLIALLHCVVGQQKTSFGMLNVRSRQQPAESADICVNFQEFGEREVPEGPFRVAWWDNSPTNTAVCQPPTTIRRFGPNEIVPIQYRTWPQELQQQCAKYRFYEVGTRNPIGYQANIAQKAGAPAVLFLVQRGSQNMNGTRNFLHSKFCNHETDESGNGTVFYIHKEAFDQQVVPKLRVSPDVELRFRKPGHNFDIAILLLWLLVLLAVALGSLWTAKAARDRLVRKGSLAGGPNEGIEMRLRGANADAGGASGETKKLPFLRTICWAAIALVGGIFLLVVFLHWSDEVTAIFWTILGIFCVSKCLFAVCKYIIFPQRRGEQRVLLHFRNFRLTPLGLICYILAAAICIPWFFIRKHPNAFLLLNLIDLGIAVYGIKFLTYEPLKKGPNLRSQWICSTFLFLIGIIFMVWLFLSPNEAKCGPTAPVDTGEQQIGSFFVPMLNDPLSACWDSEVERGYHHASITMFTTVLSAYFLPFWFFIDFINEHKKFPYGIVAFVAYALGLLIALMVVMFFKIGNMLLLPLLLFMPLPVWAGTILAVLKGTFSKLWKGDLQF